jgi:hypothetical protein
MLVGVANPLVCDSHSALTNTFLSTILQDFTAFTIIGCAIIYICTKRFNIPTATFATFAFFLAYTPVYYIVEANTAEYTMGADRYIIWSVIALLTLPGAWIVAHFEQRNKLGIIACILPFAMMLLMLVSHASALIRNGQYVTMCGTEQGCQFHDADAFIIVQRALCTLIALAFLTWWRAVCVRARGDGKRKEGDA